MLLISFFSVGFDCFLSCLFIELQIFKHHHQDFLKTVLILVNLFIFLFFLVNLKLILNTSQSSKSHEPINIYYYF